MTAPSSMRITSGMDPASKFVDKFLNGEFARGEASGMVRPMAPTGIAFLDKFLGGGFERGEVAAFIGGPGTGKTTLLFSIAQTMSTRERVLFAVGEEPAGRLRGHTVADEGGALKILDDWGTDLVREPRLRAEIAEFKPTVILVDTLDSFHGAFDRGPLGVRYSTLDYLVDAKAPEAIVIASCHAGCVGGLARYGRVKSADRVFHTVRDQEGLAHGLQRLSEVEYDIRALRDGRFDQ